MVSHSRRNESVTLLVPHLVTAQASVQLSSPICTTSRMLSTFWLKLLWKAMMMGAWSEMEMKTEVDGCEWRWNSAMIALLSALVALTLTRVLRPLLAVPKDSMSTLSRRTFIARVQAKKSRRRLWKTFPSSKWASSALRNLSGCVKCFSSGITPFL